MSRTRIKICGITRKRDALAAVACGADAIGLVFYPESTRAVTAGQAAEIVAGLPTFVTVTGLFVNAQADTVRDTCEQVPLQLLQFHGDEDEDFCRGFSLPYMKAIRVAGDTDVAGWVARFPAASALLLDTYRAGMPGGTGEVFDWDLVPRNCDRPLVLAGGLTAANVGAAIAATSPYAVDVSGGVEASAGIKDPIAMQNFVDAVRAADQMSGN